MNPFTTGTLFALLTIAPIAALAQQPDLTGYWTNTTLTPLQRPAELKNKAFFTDEKEAAAWEKRVKAAVDYDTRDPDPEKDVNHSYNELFRERGDVVPTNRTSLIIDPPDGRLPPLTAEGKKKAKIRAAAAPADSWEDRNLAERCITRGAPKIPGGYNNNFQILQTPNYVVILQEMIHEARIIPLDRKTHLDPSVHLWMGDSIGHWEGQTLVVETTNFDDRIDTNSFDCCGLSGEHLRVTERFTRVSPGMIDYQYTADDPVIYTRPFTVSVPLTGFPGPIYEYACHEGNLAMVGILAGARAQEKKAAAKNPGAKP
ncbi:MAG TPA: hypothetical protein VG273_17765 [Bryobacteraceae bacterium]|jgi:hypothetical protein|nr:hypothetical protein [Bryobacteraceae bacterium]